MTLFWQNPANAFWNTNNDAPFWLSSPWNTTLIGGAEGSFTEEGATYTVNGSGNGVVGSSDSLCFVNQAAVGNIEIIVKVTGQGMNPYETAGLMLSDLFSTNPPGEQCALISVSPQNGVNFTCRLSDSIPTTPVPANTTLGPSLSTPVWLRLVVSQPVVGPQSSIYGYQSQDGIDWQLVGNCTMNLPTNFFVGLAVSSNSTTTQTTATFSNFRYSTNVPQRTLGSGFQTNWTQTAIGPASGSFVVDPGSGNFTVSGTGTGVANADDNLFFVNQAVTGNSVTVAYIAGQTGPSDNSLCGLMVSDMSSSYPLAPICAIIQVYPTYPILFTYRTADGGIASALGGPSINAPTWLRMSVIQEGPGEVLVEGDYSSDGVNWNPVASVTLTLGSYFVGFAVANGSDIPSSTSNVATYQNAAQGLTVNAMLTWLRSDVGLLYDGSNNVSVIPDQSGNGYNATQIEGSGHQPTLSSNGANGLPTLVFSGSDQFLVLPGNSPGPPAPSFPTFSNFTQGACILLVLKPTALVANNCILDLGNATSDNFGLRLSDSSGGVEFYAYKGTTGSAVIASGALTTSAFQLLEVVYDGIGSASLFVNGVQLAQNNQMVALNNLSRRNNCIGQAGSGGNYFQGDIPEIIIYNSIAPITDAVRESLENYFLNKYSL